MGETIRGRVTLHFRAFEEDGQWVGSYVELGLSTCADTCAEAARGIIEATTLYLETLQDEGGLTRVLAEAGVEVKHEPGATWEKAIPVPA